MIKEQLPDKKTTGDEYREAYRFVQQYLKDNFQGQTVTLFMSDENGVEGEVVSTGNVMKELVWWTHTMGGMVSITLANAVSIPKERDDYGKCECEGWIGRSEACCEDELEIKELVWSCGAKDFIGLPSVFDILDIIDADENIDLPNGFYGTYPLTS